MEIFVHNVEAYLNKLRAIDNVIDASAQFASFQGYNSKFETIVLEVPIGDKRDYSDRVGGELVKTEVGKLTKSLFFKL